MKTRQIFENSFDKKINELKKTIYLLEWDIPRVKNSDVKALKELKLTELRNELNKVLEEKTAAANQKEMGVNAMAKRGKKKEKTEECAE